MSFAIPFVQPPVAPRLSATCAGCMNKAGQVAAKDERINALVLTIADLHEQITDLQAAVNQAAPTDRETAELRVQMHLNARQEQEQRRRGDQLERELASERRAIENLRVRLRAAGITP